MSIDAVITTTIAKEKQSEINNELRIQIKDIFAKAFGAKSLYLGFFSMFINKSLI